MYYIFAGFILNPVFFFFEIAVVQYSFIFNEESSFVDDLLPRFRYSFTSMMMMMMLSMAVVLAGTMKSLYYLLLVVKALKASTRERLSLGHKTNIVKKRRRATEQPLGIKAGENRFQRLALSSGTKT
jgi:hypothetical protein